MEENKIVYKPHCGNCGSLIDMEVAYRYVYEKDTETMLANMVCTEVYPDRCDNCGATFNTIEIQMPKQLNDICLG